ncbi:MAG: methionyl-tRNA formyltransferase [Flavobacterium sp.]
MRIVFMGTPEFAEGILKYIIEKKWNVVSVVTIPDKPAGRGLQLQSSPVKKLAESNQIPVLQPNKLKDPDFLNALESMQADVFVVVAFRMLPEIVWKMPKLGTFNLHGSLLPQLRGAAPIQWALIYGLPSTGVSTFFIDDKIDTGEVILQKEISILKEDNLSTLYQKLMDLGCTVVDDTLHLLQSGNATTFLQQESEDLLPAPKLTKENTKIDWNVSAKQIQNLVRGLNPFPTAWTNLMEDDDSELLVKVYEVKISEEKNSLTPGAFLIENKKWLVGTKDEVIEMVELQMPGKKRMQVKDLLNGWKGSNHGNFV